MNKISTETRMLKYLSKEQTDCLKGLFAILVLVHHLYQHSGLISNLYLGVLFNSLGYFAVAIFLFLSGFDLEISYKKNGQEYLRGFVRSKIIPFDVV